MEFPVLYFDVEAAEIPSDSTGRHNAMRLGTLHLPIISSPTPNLCLLVRVYVSAMNEIGRSASAITVTQGTYVIPLFAH
jgi:hypothetical protein